MNILLVIPSLDAGGAERMMSELANYWNSSGHQVSIVHMKPENYVPFYPVNPAVRMVPMAKGHLAHPESSIGKLLIYLKATFHVRRTICSVQPDIVISFLKTTNMVTLLAMRGVTIPIVISERSDPIRDRNSYLFDQMRRQLYRRARKIVMQTEFAAAFFRPAFNDKIRALPNWVHRPNTVKPIADVQKPTRCILSVGRLIPSKGFDLLIQAFAQIAPLFPNLKLTIYGEGDERTRLENLAQTLCVSDRVSLPGRTKHIETVLLQFDLFVFPSRYEGFPNALCEALSVGLPVIASNCPGNVDVVTDRVNGWLFPVGDADRCAQLMKELIEDSGQRVFLSQNARKISDTLSADRILEQWDSMVEMVIQKKMEV
jgi:GalNAc-alpha-(1->4)-GalNAc-alpha-(1->3)-diNAcBac-PP-undecaprenol alpha-1,4-N-acetyl-D-galactosaminyltransferase